MDTELARHSNERFFYRLTYPAMRLFFLTPLQGAQTTLYCCLEESIVNDSGKYYAGCKEKRPQRRALIEADQKKLWEISEQAVGLKVSD